MKSFVFLLLLFNFLHSKIIANIPEASGICYIQSTKHLIVVNDEGFIYELTTQGEILRKKYIGSYDFEGVTFYKGNLLVVVEDKHVLFTIDIKNFNIIKKVKIKKHKNVKKSKKSGLEGITIVNNTIYLSHQTAGLLQLKKLKKNKLRISHIHKDITQDISGLSFHKGYLYMLSDKHNLLIKYDIKKNKILKKIKLPKSAQEGLCFDHSNNTYIADDNGYIHKYTHIKP